ncbi:hypothetical protein N7507_003298 [Penicillium longicatenatum]|nr:hypothetical protein N7507_003298 [Penicillium longicatenatum]
MALAIANEVTGFASSHTQLNFRPDNLTLIDLYHWVGLYYNATTYVDLFPYAELATSETLNCLKEPSTLNSDDDPVNAFLTLWPLEFNFSTLPLGRALNEITAIKYAFYSSNPVYVDSNEICDCNNFIWSLEKTQAPPYNLSSTLTNYPGVGGFQINDITDCTDGTITNWVMSPMVANSSFNGTYFPDPTINLQFDATTANLTLEGYFEADPMYLEANDWEEGPVLFTGKSLMTFAGVIDSYHSDVLKNAAQVVKYESQTLGLTPPVHVSEK